MNHVYRIVWSESAKGWTVASELAAPRGKVGSVVRAARRAAVRMGLVGSVAFVALPGLAQTTTYTPGASNNEGSVINVNGGTASLDGSVEFTGSVGTIAETISAPEAFERGYLTGGPYDLTQARNLATSSQNNGVAVVDPITQGSVVVKTYATDNLREIDPGAHYNIYSPTPAGAEKFNDAGIAKVSGGGTFNMNATGTVGDGTTKNTTFVHVTDGTANWNSSNEIRFASLSEGVDPAAVQARDASVQVTTYNGTFSVVTTDGAQTMTVNSLADLKAYNNWLIEQLEAGKLGAGAQAQSAYDDAFNQAFTQETGTYQLTPYTSPISPDDPMFIPNGELTGMLAEGANATGHVAAGATIKSSWASERDSALLKATNGGTIINDGTVSNARFVRGMVADSGGRIINNGVRNVGDLGDGAIAEIYGDSAKGSGTSYVNNGIVNQSVWNWSSDYTNASRWLTVDEGAAAQNFGAVNVGVNVPKGGSTLTGVVLANSSFVNEADGVMYLGRAASTDVVADPMAQGGEDVALPDGGTIIYALSGSSVANHGTLAIGDKVQGGRALWASGTNVDVVNDGTITVKGHYSEAPLMNVGIESQATSGVVKNAGTIDLQGTNNVGILATRGGQASTSGVVNVAGGADPATGLRSYGVWAEGAGSSVDVSGAVNLSGDGAIGVHARDGGTITIAGGGVNFSGGAYQTGFFAHGAGSTVNIYSPPTGGALDVSSDNSTLLRIEDGASINNPTGAQMFASGAGSTAILVTGVGSTANLDNADIAVTGQGATALKVEGGATGQMSGAAQLSLGDGVIGVSVDDNKYDIGGNLVGTANSEFTNTANVTTTGRDVTVFQVKNGGKLITTGNIDVAHGTGIEVIGAGAEVTGDTAGNTGTIAVHDGKAGIYVHGGGTLTTSQRITVDNGASGVLAGVDAGKVVLTQHAGITGLSGNYGNLVTNQAADGNMLVDGATLEMAGSGAALLTENNLDTASHGDVLVSSTNGGKGLAVARADGSQTDGDLTVGSNWNIDVTGNGAGVYANTAGKVSVASQSLNVTGPGTGIDVAAADMVIIEQGAHLTATDANAVLVAGAPKTLINQGTLQGVAGSDAVRLDDSGHVFENSAGGAITGHVRLGNGTNTALLENSTINGDLVGGAGEDTVTIRGNAVQVAGTIDGGRSGAQDTLVFDGVDYTVDANSRIDNFENATLTNNATLTLRQALRLDDDQMDNGVLTVEQGSTLAAATGSTFALNNRLAGNGLITTDTGGQDFDFTDNVGSDFTGTVKLGNSTFELGGPVTRALGTSSGDINTMTLANATLELGDQSHTTVNAGDQQIGGLKFSGGTIAFDASVPDATVAKSTITTPTLDASGTGTVQVNTPNPYEAVTPAVDTQAALMEQDDGSIGMKLVNSTTTIGSGGALELQNQDGVKISDSDPTTIDIAQGGQVVAKADYDYGLSAQADGLYVNYGLQKLDVQQGQTLSLQQRDGATGPAADMAAQIVGTGSLAIDAGAGAVSLSNANNSYTGETTVDSGTLQLAADNALGQTSALNLKDATTAQLGSYEQTIGQLHADAGSTLDLQSGTLNIQDGGNADALKGAGQLNINGGTLAVAGANGAMSGSTTIASGAEAVLKSTQGLGSGALQDEGTLTLDGAQGQLANGIAGAGVVAASNAAQLELTGDNSAFAGDFKIDSASTLQASEARHLGSARIDDAGTLVVANAADWTLDNAVSGAGAFVKDGAGTLNIGDAVQHGGTTSVSNGTLIVGDATHANRILGAAGAGEVTVAKTATLAGSGTVSGHVGNDGVISALNALPTPGGSGSAQAKAAGAPNGTLTLAQGLTNRGLVNLAGAQGSAPGNVLHVKGDYVGDGGRVQVRTVMGGDESATDKLVIDGGKASGDTGVVVQAAGGEGAQTVQGIRVVETRNGATTGADAFHLDPNSSGYRQGKGTMAAGAYDYSLVRGGNGGQAEDWYLTSVDTTVVPTAPDGGGTVTPQPPTYRPEVGAYLANRQAAMMMTAHTLHERQGQAPGVDGQGESIDGNGWLRVAGSNSERDGAGPLSSVDSSNYLAHGGADIFRFSDGGEGNIRIGAMGMYGHTNSDYRNPNGVAQGEVDGYNLGIYGTWYGKRDILSGPYVDAWLMGGYYQNKVQGEGLAEESYNAMGAAASLEAGYSFKVHDDGEHQMFIEPQAQIIVSNYDADDHAEAATGTVVSGMDDTGVTTRLGVRVHGQTVDDAGNRLMRPFAELNWWHGDSTQAMQFNGDSVSEGLPSDRAEVKVGLQGNLSKNVSAWGTVGGEVGENGYQAGKVQLGMKYSW